MRDETRLDQWMTIPIEHNGTMDCSYMTGTLECITHPHPSPSNMAVAVDGVKSCHDGQDEHNRLGADGDICLPFEMSPVGYSDALQQSSD